MNTRNSNYYCFERGPNFQPRPNTFMGVAAFPKPAVDLSFTDK